MGITTDGTNIWIIDYVTDMVYKFTIQKMPNVISIIGIPDDPCDLGRWKDQGSLG